MSNSVVVPSFKYLVVSVHVKEQIGYLQLNRPSKSNALNMEMWQEFGEAVNFLAACEEVRVLVLSGNGRNFCAGIDLQAVGADILKEEACPGRTRTRLLEKIKWMQSTFSALEECPVPVIAQVQGYAFGAAVDMLVCCDLRFCTNQASFSVKEVDVAITADIGTLQRLPGIVGEGVARDWALTARTFHGPEARATGFVSGSYPTEEELAAKVRSCALSLASKSPLALRGTKATLLQSRDLTVAQGLDYVAARSAATLISQDIKEAISASMQKRSPIYSKL
mmetsp:Transcript_18255/g.25308  ORF Transcript_18255/g.25308 Transcript_18255/m.25308 type:complete len:280 (-) Transcript_18255:200-1039(-)|eukprot:CAMPEP_0196588612 /NCGR_PEP_ID=MMETSP1081-20130531/61084_1 /TAXON_ID=36882 /ORGANISM="Pyramimonas amylifera, Strain CCMP720" /LENGTH=279 /DNA_ID=CAMNT_0041911151 /DNA_START=34 /DNA_END=873 /DNA_ORIENTATION=+